MIILISSAYFFLTNKRLSHLIDKKESNSISVSDDRTISNIDFNTYSKIIESHINTLIPLNYEHCIKTETMHKNGSYLYAQCVISSSKSDNLYFDIILVLNIIKTPNIKAKYNTVFKIALLDIINLNSVIPTSNNLAVNNDKPCDTTNPNNKPAISDKTPTIKVSLNNIFDIFLLLIPRVI